MGVLTIALTGCDRKAKAPAPPPQLPVVVEPVGQQDVEVVSSWIGTTKGFIDAQIRPKVQGYLLEQLYTNGAYVAKGTLLFTIDPRPFQAALDAAAAQKKSAESQKKKFQQDVDRYTPLAASGAVSQEDLDTAVAQRDVAEASILEAEASIEQARLNLDWCKVTAPIEGFAGISNAQVGDLVSPADLLTTLSCVNPIKVQFPISEREYLAASERLLAGGTNAPVITLLLANDKPFGEKGTVSGIDDQVGVSTGTIRVEAQFANPKNLLRPGQYARVQAVTGVLKGALMVPQRAVVESQGARTVTVVGSDSVAKVTPVVTGPRVGSNWVITAGVKAGDRVVVEGLQKARPGTKVMPLTAEEFKHQMAAALAASTNAPAKK